MTIPVSGDRVYRTFVHERPSSGEGHPSGLRRTWPSPNSPEDRTSIASIVGPDDERRFTDSGIEIKPLYDTNGELGAVALWRKNFALFFLAQWR